MFGSLFILKDLWLVSIIFTNACVMPSKCTLGRLSNAAGQQPVAIFHAKVASKVTIKGMYILINVPNHYEVVDPQNNVNYSTTISWISSQMN